MLACYSAELGVTDLDKFFHYLPVSGCCIFGVYTSNRLRKSWYTVRTYSKVPNYHQLKNEILTIYIRILYIKKER